MALTFTTGMTEIDDCDAVTDWAAYKITAGGGSPSAVLDTDIKKEGTGSIGCTPTASKDCGLSFDYYNANGNTVLNLSTAGNEVLGVWMLILSPALIETFQNGGGYIIVCAADAVPSSSNKWAKWYVQGSDNFYEGWNYFQIDTRKTPTASNGGWVAGDLAAIYQVGVGTITIDSWRADWLYVDRMVYGRPIYTLKGDGATVADWADFLSDSGTNANGLIQDVNGAYELSCGIQIGDDGQTATTTFLDATNQVVNFKRHTYYSGGTVDALTYSDYYKISGEGAASYATSITFGSLVGTDEGITGGTIRSLDPTNVTVDIDFNTDQAHMSALNMYGVTFQGITGNIDLGDNSGFNYFSCTFLNCDQVDANGDPEIRNCLFIDTINVDSALLWNESIDIQYCSFIANTIGAAVEHPSAVGTPYGHVGLQYSGNTDDVLNSSGSAITINNSGNPASNGSSSEGSAVTFLTAIDLIITVQDKDTNAIVGARVGVYKTSDRTELMNEETIAGGIAQQSYNGGATNIEVRVRDVTGTPKYKPFSTLGVTGGSDYELLVTLEEDPNA